MYKRTTVPSLLLSFLFFLFALLLCFPIHFIVHISHTALTYPFPFHTHITTHIQHSNLNRNTDLPTQTRHTHTTKKKTAHQHTSPHPPQNNPPPTSIQPQQQNYGSEIKGPCHGRGNHSHCHRGGSRCRRNPCPRSSSRRNSRLLRPRKRMPHHPRSHFGHLLCRRNLVPLGLLAPLFLLQLPTQAPPRVTLGRTRSSTTLPHRLGARLDRPLLTTHIVPIPAQRSPKVKLGNLALLGFRTRTPCLGFRHTPVASPGRNTLLDRRPITRKFPLPFSRRFRLGIAGVDLG